MTTTNAASDETISLPCEHCGGNAITRPAATGFRDEEGECCDDCGFPGCAVVDEDGEAYWSEGDPRFDRCADEKCEDCAVGRAAARSRRGEYERGYRDARSAADRLLGEHIDMLAARARQSLDRGDVDIAKKYMSIEEFLLSIAAKLPVRAPPEPTRRTKRRGGDGR